MDADLIQMIMSVEDVLLFGGVVLDNILDHRRRLAHVPPPNLPLFSAEEMLEQGNEMLVGSDELVGAASRAETAVYHAGSLEVLPPGLSAEQIAYDALGFSGNAPAFVDLDLSLRFPNLMVTLCPNDKESRDTCLVRMSAKGFEMTLTELYDRTQYVDIGLQQVLVDAPLPGGVVKPFKVRFVLFGFKKRTDANNV